MYGLGFSSYYDERERELLNILRQAIFVLKLDAQNQLQDNGFTKQDVNDKKQVVIKFLLQFKNTLYFLVQGSSNNDVDVDLSFTPLANRFIKTNPSDVQDRIEMFNRLRSKLEREEKLLERDFQLLDRLQSHLEDEVAQAIQSLFRL